MANVTVNNVPPPVLEAFHKRLLSVHKPKYIYSFGAMREEMEANAGEYIKFRRYRRLSPFPVPLSDTGDPIPSTTPNISDISAKIQLFGQWMGLNQRVTLSNQDPVAQQLVDLLGISLRETEDLLIRSVILSSASFINATGGNNGDNPTEVSLSDIDDVTTLLISNDAMMMLEQEGGELRFGSSPLNDSFIGLCHTDMIPRLNAMQDFVKKASYSKPSAALLRAEWGSVSNARVFVSSVGARLPNASALGATVYPLTLMGAEATAIVDQDNFSSELIIRPAWVSDPLGQNGTLAVTTAMASVITDESWLSNLYCTI